ncbi:N-acetylmuramoyl-L-alanine amidase [Clostridiaceae bacterium 35-E11]
MFGKKIFIVIKLNKRLCIILMLLLISLWMMTMAKGHNLQSIFHHGTQQMIVIDPGHGGVDGGTSYGPHLLEKNINLDIALELRKYLKRKNFYVVMTRDKDISLENRSNLNDSRYKRDLDARKRIINDGSENIFVSIHVNAYPENEKVRGIKIFYYPTAEESQSLAKAIGTVVNDSVYKKLLKDNHTKVEIIPNDYYILRETKTPGVLIEAGFITNVQDRKLLNDKKYKKKVAEAIGEGIIRYVINE